MYYEKLLNMKQQQMFLIDYFLTLHGLDFVLLLIILLLLYFTIPFLFRYFNLEKVTKPQV